MSPSAHARIVAGATLSLWIAGLSPILGQSLKTLQGHVPEVVTQLKPKEHLAADKRLRLALALPLRNQQGLTDLLRQLYDPRRTNFHVFLTPSEFTARFGPTEQDYQSVVQFAERNSLVVVENYSNRLVLDVEESAANFERAFSVTLRT